MDYMGSNEYWFPCPVCGALREVSKTKARKPYVNCAECGVQLFVRSEVGMRRFAAKVRDKGGKPAPVAQEVRPRPPRPRGRPKKSAEVQERVERLEERAERLAAEKPAALTMIGNRRRRDA